VPANKEPSLSPIEISVVFQVIVALAFSFCFDAGLSTRAGERAPATYRLSYEQSLCRTGRVVAGAMLQHSNARPEGRESPWGYAKQTKSPHHCGDDVRGLGSHRRSLDAHTGIVAL